ncbi:MAG: hypothetical protein OJF60_000786 [Burkholderiaceae bacterium]|jgi:predicted alpha/beta hydrolase family esterase|nr:MAG: hypothetical protein OJF60_000786 [Burkholderiaceae bacterium]
MIEPTVLIVPGLRDAVAEHWQTLLEARLRDAARPVVSVPPMGRAGLDCVQRVAAIERAAQAIDGPIVIVAHSGGVVMAVHWAMQTCRQVHGALLATPPDFERPMPDGYPSIEALLVGGWLPVPRRPLPFPSIVGASRNDPLASFGRVARMAQDWGSLLVDLGPVGHLNPASGYGPWPRAEELIRALAPAAAEGVGQ